MRPIPPAHRKIPKLSDRQRGRQSPPVRLELEQASSLPGRPLQLGHLRRVCQLRRRGQPLRPRAQRLPRQGAHRLGPDNIRQSQNCARVRVDRVLLHTRPFADRPCQPI